MILTLGLLAGCVTTEGNREAFARLQGAPACCLSLADIPVQPAAFGFDARFDITEASPVFQFGARKSHFSAFALPASDTAYRIVVRGLLSTAAGGAPDPVFQPALLFLNADRQPVLTVGIERFGYAGSTFLDGPGLEVTTTVEPAIAARYLVIYTAASGPEDGRVLPFRQSLSNALLFGSAGNTHAGGGTVRSQPTPTGNLRLTIRPPDR